MKYIFVVLISSLFVSCALQEEPKIKEKSIEQKEQVDIVLDDLINIPQDISFYTKNLQDEKIYDIQKKYEESYFSVWNIEKSPRTLDEIQWPFKVFNADRSYGENLLPIKKDFIDEMYKKSNFTQYNTLNKKALTLKYSNIRAFPTSKPLLRNPALAGEGFPFDYLQNSSINANVPLFVSHYSLDKQWVFVFNSFTFGWLKSDEVVFIDNQYALDWKNAQQVFITKEGVSLYNEDKDALFSTRIGMVFPLIAEDDTSYTILTVSTYKQNSALFNKSIISKDAATKKMLALTQTNINKIIKEVSKTNYGWGGVYGQRDCSSTLMDFYTPFGIWLPRNSSKQSEKGAVLDLSSLNDLEKIQRIKQEAIPFQTLLYKKGHIVLYAGIYKNEIIVFQNVWGVRTKEGNEEGRFLVGKTVFSTLKLGSELKNYDKKYELLRSIKSMNTVTR